MLITSISYSKDAVTIRVGNFAPNYFKDKDGNWTGVDVELGKALVDEAGFTPEIVNLPWSRALKYAKQGKVDMLVNASLNADRLDYFYWIGPERLITMSLITKEYHRHLKIENLDDFTRLCKELKTPFAYQQDVNYPEEFNTKLINDADFKNCFTKTVNPKSILKMLSKNWILGYFDEKMAIEYYKNNDPNYRDIAVHPFILSQEPVFFAASKKSVDVDVANKLYEAYYRLWENGKIKEIIRKWGKISSKNYNNYSSFFINLFDNTLITKETNQFI